MNAGAGIEILADLNPGEFFKRDVFNEVVELIVRVDEDDRRTIPKVIIEDECRYRDKQTTGRRHEHLADSQGKRTRVGNT